MEINQYTIEQLTFQDESFYDIDFWTGSGYETRKILGSTIKAGILASMPPSSNVYNADGTLTGDRILTGDNFQLFFQTLGEFIVHSHKTGVDNIVFEVRSDPTFHGFIVKDHNTGVHMLACRDGKVEISDSYFLPDVDGTTGQVMITDGAGNLSWYTIPPSTDTNIYNADGSLTATRFLTLNGFTLYFSDLAGTTRFTGGNIWEIIANAGSPAIMRLDAGNNQKRSLEWTTASDLRWELTTDGLENIGNIGTDLVLNAYDDAGIFIGEFLRIERSTGLITINSAFTLPNSDGTIGQVLTTNGAGVTTWETPTGGTGEKRIGQDYAYNMSSAGGYTWNGTTVGATSIVTLLERWRLQSFVGVGQADGCFTNFILPSSYIAGNSIVLSITTTEDGTGGDIKYWIGLSKPTAGGAFGGAVDTQWIGVVHTAQAGYIVDTLTATFLGTNLVAGEPISVLIYRDPSDPQDTYTGASYVNAISAEQL